MKISFLDNWTCYRQTDKEAAFPVSIPHDAMLLDERKEDGVGGVNTGWYNARNYVYTKTFYLDEYQNKDVLFEFEGVYHKAKVIINDVKVFYQQNGYIGFTFDATKYLYFGQENIIRVEVTNDDQPNSRWYSGTGIYRPVWMHVVPKNRVALDGIQITTKSTEPPAIEVDINLEKKDIDPQLDNDIQITVHENESQLASYSFKENDEKHIVSQIDTEQVRKLKYRAVIDLPTAKLWDENNPNIYNCTIAYGEDTQSVTFGIRNIQLTKQGLLINGKRTLLRGACIHHDNGLLGACAYDYAEYRKVYLLKKAGYNAIRSAHNPCSKAFLEACDQLGMMVVDEYADSWYIHKTHYDYADSLMDNFKYDLKKIVEKDYNHPSVIMYSIGNEVSETAQKQGIKLTEDMTNHLHQLDATRPVTCGINIFFNLLSSIGFGVYSDKKAKMEEKKGAKKSAVGSEFFNNLAGLLGSDFMKFGATLYPCDLKTKDAFSKMDVAGYNYGIRRYHHDAKKYSSRYILGSETFVSDAYNFWEDAKKIPTLIGDFVWAGMDYLGECGIGSMDYLEDVKSFDHGCGWIAAGSGRIDLTGKETPEMQYTRVAFEQQEIGMGVVPVNHSGEKHAPSAWRMTNAVDSWSWENHEGKMATVEVYARASKVKLFLNEECVGTKTKHKGGRYIFKTPYYPGELLAVSYNERGEELARTSLKSAGKETKLSIEAEEVVPCQHEKLCYVRLRFTDNEGIVKPGIRERIQISVNGGELIGFGSGCPYTEDGFLKTETVTYYGEALAIIKPKENEAVTINATSRFGEEIYKIVL